MYHGKQGVKEICGYTFCGCMCLERVTIPKSVKKIGKYAFRGCHWQIALIAPYFPISDFEKDDKLLACRGFARAYLENAALDEEINAGYLRYIKSQRKKLYQKAIMDGALLHLLFAARLLQPEEVEDLMGYKAYFTKGTEALIREYQARYLAVDPVKEAERESRAAERTAKNQEEFQATGVMKVTEAQKLFTFKREKDNIIINSYKGTDPDVVIPQVIGKSPVTGINGLAPPGRPGLTSVTIPEGVKEIGSYAFAYCSRLISVVIPESVKEIGGDAFDGCTSLQSVTIQKGVEIIAPLAFCDCTSLTSVNILEGVKGISNHAFSGCTNLQRVSLPKSLMEIDHDAFCGCTSLQSVTIPEGIKEIGSQAFGYCASLASVELPENFMEFSGDAFEGTPWSEHMGELAVVNHVLLNYMGGDSHVTIPEDVWKIGDWAFKNCESLTGITIPGSVKDIGEYAFGDCTSLQSVTIPANVIRISYGAFRGCAGWPI